MRLWSLHPQLLDRQGLTACWREGLLARKVLHGQTKGYRNHPQLHRFRDCPEPLAAIDTYLAAIVDKAARRGYNFDSTKLSDKRCDFTLPVTTGQVEYEIGHLIGKLEKRSPHMVCRVTMDRPPLHPLFALREGPVEQWEIAGQSKK